MAHSAPFRTTSAPTPHRGEEGKDSQAHCPTGKTACTPHLRTGLACGGALARAHARTHETSGTEGTEVGKTEEGR
jgi:hypothetical protein